MSLRASRHVFVAVSAALASAVTFAGGCSEDDAIVGGECASGYARCGQKCCFAGDGTLADGSNDGAMQDVLLVDGYPGTDGYPGDGHGPDGSTPDGSSSDGANGDGTLADGPETGDGSTDGSLNNPDAACSAPLTTCGGMCVDTTSDSNNCGSCLFVCPPHETCVGSLCGHVTGGVVYIGDDYSVATGGSQAKVLVNAANIAPTFPVNILSYEKYAQFSSINNVNNILPAPTYNITHTNNDPQVVGTLTIKNFGVFLVHDQTGASSGALATLGQGPGPLCSRSSSTTEVSSSFSTGGRAPPMPGQAPARCPASPPGRICWWSPAIRRSRHPR